MRLFKEEVSFLTDIGTNIKTYISNEAMVHMQNFNDPAIEEICNKINNVIPDIKNNVDYTTNAKTFIQSAQGQELFTSISKILLDRFGLTFQFFHMPGELGCTTAYAAGGASIFEQSSLVDIVETAYRAIEDLGQLPYDQREQLGLNALRAAFAKQIELADYITKNKIEVNLKRAYISNLPVDLVHYICIDVVTLVRNYAATARQVVAVLLHEVGHAFLNITICYRCVLNNTVLLNTFIENIERRNKSWKEAIILSYSKITKQDMSKLKDKNFIQVCTSIFRDVYTLDNSTYNFIDNEQQADQFAGRFGYQDDLVTIFQKTNFWLGLYMQKLLAVSTVGTFISAIIFMACTVILGSCPFVLTIFGALAVTVTGAILGTMSFEAKFEDDVNSIPTYDNLTDRLKRIKLEAVRLLRQTDNVKVKKSLLAKLEAIDKVDIIKQKRLTLPTNYISKFWNAITARRLEIRDLERLTEELMENDLHTSSAKLQMLIKK